MQFHIPQYIDIEDKIFGPLTLKQAIYVAGGVGGAYLVWRTVPYIFISAPLIFGIGLLAWALAFFPREKLGRPFIEVLEAGFNYMLRDKLYTWKKTTKEAVAGKEEQFLPSEPLSTPVVPSGKLSSTSFNLDVRGAPKTGEIEKDRQL
ncbi:MAG: PrgI family protein [bacterium]|nr:PrgI family protein [bacterium]